MVHLQQPPARARHPVVEHATAGPNPNPVWGNGIATHIQINGFKFIVDSPEVLEVAKFKLPPELSGLIAADATVKLQAPKVLTAAELHKEYERAKVQPHGVLQKWIQQATLNPAKLGVMSRLPLGSLSRSSRRRIAALANTNGNTDYEQLECIGLDEGTGSPDALVGTLAIKRPSGYLGGPCTASSAGISSSPDRLGQRLGVGRHAVGHGPRGINAIPKEGLSFIRCISP